MKSSRLVEWEVLIEELDILNESSTPPFPIDSDESNPETRLKFRYIDLRGNRVRDNLLFKSKSLQIHKRIF